MCIVAQDLRGLQDEQIHVPQPRSTEALSHYILLLVCIHVYGSLLVYLDLNGSRLRILV